MHSHHGHHHDHDHDSSSRNLGLAFFLNLFFTIVELVGGILTNSLAILSDALHDFGDSLSLGMAWILEKVSRKERSRSFSYGYRRFSLLGALINALILLVGSGIIISNAIPKLFDPGNPDPQGMLYLAILGIVFNGAGIFLLKKGKSINERVVMLHLLEDVLGWMAILIGSVIMQFYDVPVLDPIMSLLIAAFVIYNAAKSLKSTVKIFLQAVPDEIAIAKIEKALTRIKGVKSVHDTHLWTMDGRYNILTIHLVLSDNTTVEEMISVKQAAREIARQHNIQHATLEIGLETEDCELKDC